MYGEVGAFQVSVLMGQARSAVVGWSSGLGVFSAHIRYHPLLHHPQQLVPGEMLLGTEGLAAGPSPLLPFPGALGFLGATVSCLALDLGDF